MRKAIGRTLNIGARLWTSRGGGVLLEYVLITLMVVTPLVVTPLFTGLETGNVARFGEVPRWFAYRWQTIMRGVALPIP